MQRFYSNGKLLLTSEYVVLNGAKALALPTKFGQDLIVENTTDELISWMSFDVDKSCWLSCNLKIDDIINNSFKSDADEVLKLVQILQEAHKLNSDILTNSSGFKVTTNLSFNRKLGLGTSSTLINNIAQWFSIDAFVLLENTFKGSGYDIACAQTNDTIFYTLTKSYSLSERIIFRPEFKDNLFFVYLNQKKNSRDAIKYYNSLTIDKELIAKEFSNLSDAFLNAKSLEEFNNLVDTHEQKLSKILNIKSIKEQLFADFKGSIKSLGAWEGDFILATGTKKEMSYFTKKGYNIMYPFSEIIL